MTMLIRGGLLHTMTEQGDFTGDVLVQEGRIAAVAPVIELPPEVTPCTLSAHGLHVLPGLMDLCIGETAAEEENLLHSARAAGVTCGVVWNADEGPCQLLTADGLGDAGIHRIRPEAYTDGQLLARLKTLHEEGILPAAEVAGTAQCRRILSLAGEAGVKLLLRLQGCEGLEKEIAASGCPVLLGIRRGTGASPWAMAARLDAMGVPVALTVDHPDAVLRRLPLCAGLCVREGLPRDLALSLITSSPADILGISEAGRIRPGDRADLVLYDGDPLLLSTAHVVTIQNGKICC